jgi:hypothetical protein
MTNETTALEVGDDKKPSTDRRARSARLVYAEHSRARTEVDGVMVSTLLGTAGHPEHGDETGYMRYSCRCRPCTTTHSVYWRTWESGKRTVERFGVVAPILTTNWPGEQEPADEDLRELAEAIIDRWASARKYRVGPLTKVLEEHWPTLELAELSTIAADLVDALATTSRRGAKPAPRE